MSDAVEKYKIRRKNRLDARNVESCFHEDYGVKGMKWGEHNAEEENATSDFSDIVEEEPFFGNEEVETVKAGGKEWTKESLTQLWQDRGYGKREAKKRAEKDFSDMVESQKKTREAEKVSIETKPNYGDIFGKDTKVTKSMKDEVSAIQKAFGNDAKVKKASEWDDGEYDVNGRRITVDDIDSTKYGRNFKKYFDYKDINGKRVYWEK